MGFLSKLKKLDPLGSKITSSSFQRKFDPLGAMLSGNKAPQQQGNMGNMWARAMGVQAQPPPMPQYLQFNGPQAMGQPPIQQMGWQTGAAQPGGFFPQQPGYGPRRQSSYGRGGNLSGALYGGEDSSPYMGRYLR